MPLRAFPVLHASGSRSTDALQPLADLFGEEQARRLFGPIGVGGTLGAIAGAAATGWLVGGVDLPRLGRQPGAPVGRGSGRPANCSDY